MLTQGIRNGHSELLVMTAGGTVDSSLKYVPGKDAVFDGRRYTEDAFRQSRIVIPYRFVHFPQMDSKYMTHDDRERILSIALEAPEKNILVGQGSDTAVETGEYFGPRIQSTDKKLAVFVGFTPISFQFYGKAPFSDGPFNIGMAIGCVLSMPPGSTWIVAGDCFPWDNVRKNPETQRFERIRRERFVMA